MQFCSITIKQILQQGDSVTTNPDPQLAATADAAPFLQIKHIVKKFDDVFAVDDVTLDIQQGEIFALLGSSGCGKSTLLRMLAGFEVPTAGSILLAGRTLLAWLRTSDLST